MQPLLQIIHISDLHISESSNDKALLARKQRYFRLKFRQYLEKGAEWHEGTLGHDPTADRKFSQFLQRLASREPGWFNRSDAGEVPQTWLIDTGDLTTFGDPNSIKSGILRIEDWCKTLGHCKIRVLFGNHDAWPGTFPLLVNGDDCIEQLKRLRDWAEWCKESWFDPLTLDVPGSNLRIELYALNTVCFSRIANTRAVGAIDESDLSRLSQEIERRQREHNRSTYRILACHHPIEFPFEKAEIAKAGIIPVMRLADSEKIITFLRNELQSDPHLTPYVHLILSGHTHLSFPAAPLPVTDKEVIQGNLGERQAQLVTGALMLVRDRRRIATGEGPKTIERNKKGSVPSRVYDANQQFQILRFYYAPEVTPGLLLQRYIVARAPPDDYGVITDFGDPEDQ